MKTQVVHILTRRSLTSIPSSVVYAHEVPILKVAKGASNIEVIEENCTQFCMQPTEVRARDELIRLKNKYKGFTIEGQNPVDVAYPDGSRDLELYYEDPSIFDGTGQEDGGGVLTDEFEEVAPKPVPEDEPKVDEEPAEEAAPQSERQEVMQKLDMLGIPHAKNKSTVALQELLERSIEQGAEDLAGEE